MQYPHASLSNDFIQHIQHPFSFSENRLFLALLRCLHLKTATLQQTFSVSIREVFGTNTAGLADTIASLKERRWFGEPLLVSLVHMKGEGAVDALFNPALQKHLVAQAGWHTSIDVAELVAHGLTSVPAWRLLWLLRSYYRPKSAIKQKLFTLGELQSHFFGQNNALCPAERARLIAHLKSAVNALKRAGIEVKCSVMKRGNVAKGMVFSIPQLVLQKKAQKPMQAKERAEPAQATVTHAQPTQSVASPIPPVPPAVIGGMGDMVSLVHAAMHVNTSSTNDKRVDVCAALDDEQVSRLCEDLNESYRALGRYGLSAYQAKTLCQQVVEEPYKRFIFLKKISALKAERSTYKHDNWTAHVVKQLCITLNFDFKKRRKFTNF